MRLPNYTSRRFFSDIPPSCPHSKMKCCLRQIEGIFKLHFAPNCNGWPSYQTRLHRNIVDWEQYG